MKYIYFTTLFFLLSYGFGSLNENQTTTACSSFKTKCNYTLTDKTIKILWRENKFDKEINDSINTIIINEDSCKTLSEPEIAALGFVATFIGNDCDWDGEAKDDRSNLKCKLLTALHLGYQCSETHLGFLRRWFKNDQQSLELLENCPTTPFTSTIQETFDEIILTVKGNNIMVFFKAYGVNIREEKSWSWTETDYFYLDNDAIKLIKKEQSKVKHKRFNNGED